MGYSSIILKYLILNSMTIFNNVKVLLSMLALEITRCAHQHGIIISKVSNENVTVIKMPVKEVLLCTRFQHWVTKELLQIFPTKELQYFEKQQRGLPQSLSSL